MNIVETFLNLLEQTAFFSLSYGNYLMILVALVFLYLGIAKGFEPYHVESGEFDKRYGRLALVFL